MNGPVVLSPTQYDAALSLCIGGGSPEQPLLEQHGRATINSLVALGVIVIRRAGGNPALYHLTDAGRALVCAHANPSKEDDMNEITENDLATVNPDPKPEPSKKSRGRKPAATDDPAAFAAAINPDKPKRAEAADAPPPVEDVTNKPPAPAPPAGNPVVEGLYATLRTGIAQAAGADVQETETQSYVRYSVGGKTVASVRALPKRLTHVQVSMPCATGPGSEEHKATTEEEAAAILALVQNRVNTLAS